MNAPQDFHTMLQQQLEHLETKARLTQAEKLLRTCAAVIERQKAHIATRSDQLSKTINERDAVERKLALIPGWVRAIFGA